MGILKKLYYAGVSVLGLAAPIRKNRVVFSSYYGRGYSDNSKAICEALLKRTGELDLVWLCKDEKEAATLPEGVRAVKYDSPARILALSGARVWVDNCRKYERFKKNGQYYLQTWHGFPYKRIERDVVESLGGAYYERGARRDSAKIDLLLSNGGFVTETLSRTFWYDGEIAEWGSPRNDVFFLENADVRAAVRKAFRLPAEQKILLYAPTFRADHSTDGYRLEAEAVRKACVARFGGEWSVFIRLHPNVAAQSEGLFSYDGRGIVDATMYPDMQELLLGCDFLVTDYSSSMFDYALSKKPCLRLALDREAYLKDRNFYFTEEGLPFPQAESNEALCELIRSFDEKTYREKWDAFVQTTAFCDDGRASERCAERILEWTRSEKKENRQ